MDDTVEGKDPLVSMMLVDLCRSKRNEIESRS